MIRRSTSMIDPGAHQLALSGLTLPYSVFKARPFRLDDHLHEISCTYRNPPESAPSEITAGEQRAQWRACVRSAQTGRHAGWTLAIAGPGSIQYPEMVAAQLAAQYLLSNRVVAWINITAGLGGERSLARAIQPYQTHDLDAVVLTGLRWDGDPVRFDKAFDLLRESDPRTDRILLGVGCDPLALTRRLGIGVQRVLYVVESRLVRMG